MRQARRDECLPQREAVPPARQRVRTRVPQHPWVFDQHIFQPHFAGQRAGQRDQLHGLPERDSALGRLEQKKNLGAIFHSRAGNNQLRLAGSRAPGDGTVHEITPINPAGCDGR